MLPLHCKVYFWTCQHTSEKVRHMRACTRGGAQGGTDTAAFLEITIPRVFTAKSDTAAGLADTHVGKPPASPFCYHSHFISVLCTKIWGLLLSIGFAGFVWKLAIALRHDNTSRVLAELYLSMYFIKEKLKWFWEVEVFSPFLFLAADSLVVTLTSETLLKEETQDLFTGNNALDKQLRFKWDLRNTVIQFFLSFFYFWINKEEIPLVPFISQPAAHRLSIDCNTPAKLMAEDCCLLTPVPNPHL